MSSLIISTLLILWGIIIIVSSVFSTNKKSNSVIGSSGYIEFELLMAYLEQRSSNTIKKMKLFFGILFILLGIWIIVTKQFS